MGMDEHKTPRFGKKQDDGQEKIQETKGAQTGAREKGDKDGQQTGGYEKGTMNEPQTGAREKGDKDGQQTGGYEKGTTNEPQTGVREKGDKDGTQTGAHEKDSTDGLQSGAHEGDGADEQQDSAEYSFMREIIRHKPIDKKKLMLRIGALVCGAVVFGIVAAFVFARMLPVFQSSLQAQQTPTKVDIPTDQDPDEDTAEDAAAGKTPSSVDSTEGKDAAGNATGAAQSGTAGKTDSTIQGGTDNGTGQDTTGQTGAGGQAGADGQTGAGGQAGTDGQTGAGGQAGTDGQTGAGGQTGTDGQTGAGGQTSAGGQTGTDGQTGADGQTGTAGQTGADGQTGTDGQTGAGGAAAGTAQGAGGTAAGQQGAVTSPQEIGLEDFKKIYKDMYEVSKPAQKSLVTVVGVTSDVDWFNNTYEKERQASGLIIANNGKNLFVLTEYRILENVSRILLMFSDGTTVDANYQKHDQNTNLAVLKVKISDISQSVLDTIEPAQELLGNSYGLNKGDPVIALGSPIGSSDSIAYGSITSTGSTVSGFDMEYKILTTDIIGTSEGSGVLLNLSGEIIGIIAQAYSPDANKSTITALSISQLKPLIETLSNGSPIPYIGVIGQNVTDTLSANTGVPKGVYVEMVAEDSPAMQAGLQTADVITRFDTSDVANIKQYHDKLEKKNPGDVVSVTIMRKGTEGYVESEVEVTVGES